MVNLSIPGLLLLSAYSLNSASAGDVYEISSGNPPDIEPTSTSLETNVVTNYIPEPNADSESVHVEIQEHDNINPQDACDSEPLEQMDSDTRVLPESLDEGVPHQFSRLGHHSDMASDINDEEPSFKIGENDIIQPPWEDTAPYHSIDDEELDNLMRLTAQETSDDHEEGNGKLNTNKSEKTERKSHDTQTPQEIYEELDNLLRLTAQEIYEERKEGHGKPNTNKSEKAERKSHDTQTTQEICEECEEGHDKINKNKSGNAGIKSYDTQTPQETSDAHEEEHGNLNKNKSGKAGIKSHNTQTPLKKKDFCKEGCHGCNNKPEDNERDPSSPDDDGGCECGMTNHFVFDYKTTLLLKSLKTETSTHYYIAMAAIFTISLFPCMFKAFRAIISHKLRKNGSNAKLALSMFLSFIFSLIILTLDYGLMLLAMTFNVGYFFAIIIGSSLSYTMFGLLFDSPCDCGGKKAILSDCCG